MSDTDVGSGSASPASDTPPLIPQALQGDADLKEQEDLTPADSPVQLPSARRTCLKIGTFCEGPYPTFGVGLGNLISDKPQFSLAVVSDLKSEYVDGYHQKGIPDTICARTLDATSIESFEGVDVACVIAPYAEYSDKTVQLCANIVHALTESAVRYLILGARHQTYGAPQYGSVELYQPFFKSFKRVISVRPLDGKSLCKGYEHWFTAKGATKDTMLNGSSRFMYLSLFIVQEPPPNEGPPTFNPESPSDCLVVDPAHEYPLSHVLATILQLSALP